MPGSGQCDGHPGRQRRGGFDGPCPMPTMSCDAGIQVCGQSIQQNSIGPERITLSSPSRFDAALALAVNPVDVWGIDQCGVMHVLIRVLLGSSEQSWRVGRVSLVARSRGRRSRRSDAAHRLAMLARCPRSIDRIENYNRPAARSTEFGRPMLPNAESGGRRASIEASIARCRFVPKQCLSASSSHRP